MIINPYRIRTALLKPLLLLVFSLFEKHRSPQLGPQTFFAGIVSLREAQLSQMILPH
ncbi:Uncharacterised protein [Serratia fonticola]|nr:Uncharacterised protein [Serratia fonticola]